MFTGASRLLPVKIRRPVSLEKQDVPDSQMLLTFNFKPIYGADPS